MADDGLFPWLQRDLPIWMLLLFSALPAVVAGIRQRQMTPWYFYGFGCALFAWPLVMVPALHALLIRPRFMSKEDRQRQRRADALALLEEPSIPSYPSRINELPPPPPAPAAATSSDVRLRRAWTAGATSTGLSSRARPSSWCASSSIRETGAR